MVKSHLSDRALNLCLLEGQQEGRAGMQSLLQVEQAQALGAKARVKEGVQEGVEAAVDVGQTGGVGVSQEEET